MLACLSAYRGSRRWNRQKHPSKSSVAAASPPRDVLQQLMGREFPLIQACVSVSAAPEHHPMNGKALITQRSAGRCNGRSRFAMERASVRAVDEPRAGSDPCSCNGQRAAGSGHRECRVSILAARGNTRANIHGRRRRDGCEDESRQAGRLARHRLRRFFLPLPWCPCA
jgi:hypothetical protein